MTRVVHANCFPPPGATGELLLSDEPAVAAAGGDRTRMAEDLVDPDVAHRASVEVWRMARSWYLRGTNDDTVLADVSAGDLAGLEAALAVLMPAARGALAMTALIDAGVPLTSLVSVRPVASAGAERYASFERLAAEGAVAAARRRLGDELPVERILSEEPHNQTLRAKYARTRDAEFLLGASGIRIARELVFAGADRLLAMNPRRGPSWLVVEYNPTRAFSAQYRSRESRRRLVRWIAEPRELLEALREGDVPLGPSSAPLRASSTGVGARLQSRAHELSGADFSIAGVPLWEVVAPSLFALAERYGRYARRAAPPIARRLRRHRVEAVLVPFDNSPAVRLLVRSAQRLAIPTFSINDGIKGDDIQTEGMSTDRALAWSQAVAEHYFVRHPGGATVTGNPARDRPAPAQRTAGPSPRRVLIGSFTFSPVDLACRRADPERFIDEVLEAVGTAGAAARPEVLLKLHPADEPDHYAALLARHPALEVTLIAAGDVVDLFPQADVYVTTYSTSLLQAADAMPVIYYAVNDQRLGPPFEGDPWLERRTARSPSDLARLLGDGDLLAEPPPEGWLERYLGPSGGTDRIVAEITRAITPSGRVADAARTARGAAHPH